MEPLFQAVGDNLRVLDLDLGKGDRPWDPSYLESFAHCANLTKLTLEEPGGGLYDVPAPDDDIEDRVPPRVLELPLAFSHSLRSLSFHSVWETGGAVTPNLPRARPRASPPLAPHDRNVSLNVAASRLFYPSLVAPELEAVKIIALASDPPSRCMSNEDLSKYLVASMPRVSQRLRQIDIPPYAE
ncbi:hypothetical protein JCM11491_005031 [Sporobolomyces phaffii]